MPTLKEQLDALRAAVATKVDAVTIQTMHRATEDLRASGIMDRVVKVGSAAPAFSLPSAAGQTLSLAELHASRWLVLSFYRGVW